MFKIPVASAIIINESGKFLAGKRKNCKYGLSGLYGIPGGKIEENEDVEEALKRELYEEIGISGVKSTFIGYVNAGKFINLFFLINIYYGEIILVEPDKCEGWEWITWDTEGLVPELVEFKRLHLTKLQLLQFLVDY